jgi:RecB family exonuclease
VQTDDFSPLLEAGPSPRAVSSLVVASDRGGPIGSRDLDADVPSSRLVGTLVHRLLHRFGFDAFGGMAQPADLVSALLRPSERALVAAEWATAEFTDDVIRLYRMLCAEPRVQSAYSSGERFHEVPFSMSLEGQILRGTIDCLVRQNDGRVIVLEFKTGKPREEHRQQIQCYREAAEHLFPGAPVEAHLVYAGGLRGHAGA